MQLQTPSVGVGQARHADAVTAARSATRQARQQMHASLRPGWVLTFAGGRHDAAEVLKGVRAEIGDLPVLGGCGSGVISGATAGTSGYECGVLLFPDALAPQAILTVDGLERDEAAAGRRLGADLRALDLPADTTVLLFYDSVRNSAAPPSLHVASRLLDGLYESLPEAAACPQIIGAGTLTDLALSGSYVFDGQQACRHTAVADVLPRDLKGHVAVTHGCLPASDFLEITRIEGARVLELDGRPALTVVVERLGISREELIARQPLPSLTLGEKHGDPYAPFNEEQYVNRLVIAVDPTDDALILFEADFHVGSKVQLMSYEPWRMIESAREQTRQLLAGLPSDAPSFGLYIDCAGRSMAFSGMEEDEAAPVRQQVDALCPLLGFYSGVEIAPYLGRARPLDWTGVLAIFTHGC